MTERTTIDIYPVGLLADLKHFRHPATRGRLRRGLSYLRERARDRNWRAVRSYFNGYLAEVNYPPEELRHTLCGRGWTKRAAASSLGRRLYADNRGQ